MFSNLIFFITSKIRPQKKLKKDITEKLSKIGYTVQEAAIPIGGAQLVRRDSSGVLIGASDPRKDGCALGY